MDRDPQDSLVTSSEDVLLSEKASTSVVALPQYLKKKNRKKKSKEFNEKFPWLRSFLKLCHSSLGVNSIKVLLNLITVYTEHVSRDVIASYSKPNRAAKLKKNMIDVLCFFHNCYLNIKTPLDETVYMEKMSHLLTMYMDMEIKASRRGKENVKRITSKVISSLFIILNNSSEYILDTILKARFTVKSYSEICIPIFKRVVSLAVSQDLTYVRCLLVFKLWKRLVPRGEERNSLNRLAVSTLSPPPPQLLEMVKRGMLKNVLPTLPPNKKPALVTRFYMTSKFNLRESIKAFLKISSEFKLNELSSILDTSRFFDEPFEQESFLLSGKDTDDSFMESIWKNISDTSPSLSDSASLDVMLSVDSPKSPKKKNKCKLFKKSEKKKTEKNDKSKLKNNKQNKKEQKITKDVADIKELSFTNMPLDFLKKINLINNNIDREETCGKSSPSSTVNDDCEVKKNNKECAISQTLPILHSDQQFSQNNINLKETIEERGSNDSSNEKSNTSVKERNKISLNYKTYSEDISEHMDSTEKSELEPLSSKIKIDDNSTTNCKENIGVLKSSNHFETASLEAERLDVSQVAANDTNSQQVSDCIKKEISNSSNFVVKDNNICDDQSFSTTLFETISNRQEEKSTNSNENSVLGAASSLFDKSLTITTPFVEIGVKNNLEINDGERSKKYNTVNFFPNNQHSFRKEVNIHNLPGPDTTKCTIKDDVNVNKKSKVDDSENMIKTTEQFLNSNIKITNLVEPEKTLSPSINLHSIPKSENIRSDCMFEKSSVQAPKTDYSICGLLKPQIIIKNEQEMREYDLDNPEGHGNIFVKREFSTYLKDINEKSISPKPSATVETETEVHFDKNVHDVDHNNCKESSLLYSSNNQNLNKDTNYENTLNKDLNTCLLHNIPGEEDCLKNPSSERLFAKANLEKSLSNDCIAQPVLARLTERQDSAANSLPAPVSIPLKHWQNSSDTITNEKMDGKGKSYGCIRAKAFSNEEKYPRSMLSEITTKSSIDILPQENEPDNLEFVLRNECDNFNSTYDYESEEDSNLVIDEDFDPVKEQNESDIEETRLAVSCISDVNETLNNIPVKSIPDLREEVCKELVTRNESVTNFHYPELQKQNEVLASGQEVLGCDGQSSSCNSLDMKEITINKSSHLNNFCVKENKTSNNSSVSKNLSRKRDHSLLIPEKNNLNTKEPCRETTFSPPKVIKIADFKALHVNKPNSIEKLSSSTHQQGNNTVFMPIKQPTSSKFSVEKNPPLHTENRYLNFQHQIKQQVCDSVISVNNSLLSPKISTKPIAQEINIYGSFSTFNPENKESIATNNNNRLPPFEQFNKLKPVVNEKYQDLNLNMDTHDKLRNIPTYQDNTVKYVTNELHTGVRNHIQSGLASYSVKLPTRSTKPKQTYSKKQEKLEAHQQLKSTQVLYDTNPVQDPLCLVVNKNKEITRESLYDFVFPVAHEVEVCSASDNVSEFIDPGSSEITHPDWPIANEQSVDSSNSMQYSPTTDQYLYSSNLKCDQYCGTSENDQNCLVNSLELQQVSVDFRYPENVGKGFNKDKFNLHRRTLEVDYNLCCSQRKFKEFYLSQDVPPSIPVPYPPQGRTDLKSSVRCSCDQCSDNHQILLRNYNLLTNFRNSKVKPLSLYPKINDIFPSDRDLSCESDCSFDSSLPLKKRKTLTNSKPPEELTSYPNTPMMSIAQLELANYEQRNQVIVTNPQSHWKDTQDPRHALYLPPCPTVQQTVVNTDTKQNKRKSGKRRKTSR